MQFDLEKLSIAKYPMYNLNHIVLLQVVRTGGKLSLQDSTHPEMILAGAAVFRRQDGT